MQTWIALFRGINVGGKNIVAMAELRSELKSLGFCKVRTYIQSGNVVFESTEKKSSLLNKKIARRIEDWKGIRPQILLLRPSDLRAAIKANPFPEAVANPKALHFFFLAESATQPDLEALRGLQTSTEKFELSDRVFYLHAPDGIGRSKLAAQVEKKLGVAGTGRNYRTVEKILAMLKGA